MHAIVSLELRLQVLQERWPAMSLHTQLVCTDVCSHGRCDQGCCGHFDINLYTNLLLKAAAGFRWRASFGQSLPFMIPGLTHGTFN